MGDRIRDAFVEGHDDVRTQSFLDFDGFLWRDEFGVTIEFVLEGNAFFGDFAILG